MADHAQAAKADGELPHRSPPLDGRSDEAAASAVPLSLVFRWAATGTLGVLVVLLAGYGLYVVRGILVLVLIALCLAW